MCRESNVRGINFKNGRIVAALATGGAGFTLERLQERVFRNRFGEQIYEDILHLLPTTDAPVQGELFARMLAAVLLTEGSLLAEGDIEMEVLDAKRKVSQVEKSPLFQLPALQATREIALTKNDCDRESYKEVRDDSSPYTAPR